MNPLMVNHPYYAHEGNFFSNDMVMEYGSWAEFVEEYGEADIDMNLIIRWDWKVADPDDYSDGEDMYEPYLQLTVHGQRKAIVRTMLVRGVTDADAPAIAAYLRPHLERILDNWAPISHEWAPVAGFNDLGGIFG